MAKTEHDERARQYMDRALEAEKRLGYKSSVPEEVYRRASQRAASAFRGLSEATKSSGRRP